MSSGALVSICLVTDGSKTKIIQINANSSVADLFRKIRTEVNHARDASFTLIHHGTTLTEEGDEGQKTIDSVGIQTLDTVNFCVRNSGGNTNEHTDASNV